MRSFKATLLVAAALLSMACSSVQIREESAHHAILRPARIGAISVINEYSESMKLSVTGGGHVADSIMYGDQPYEVTFARQYLMGAPSVILTARLFTGGKHVGSVTQVFFLDRQYVWKIKRADSRYGYGSSEPLTEVYEGDSFQRGGYGLGGISIGRGSGSGRPAWPTSGRPAW